MTFPAAPVSLAANISLLFSEVPYLERPAQAASAGFTAIETWWPFAGPTPTTAEIRDFLIAVETAGVALIGMNFWAGDMAAGERGLACRPERHDEIEAGIPALLEIARATGVDCFNLLYGQPDEAVPERDWRSAGIHCIRRTAAALEPIDGTVLIEPLASGLNGAYPLLTDRDAAAVIEEAGAENVSLLFDSFHLGMNEVDLVESALHPRTRIGHVQLADAPGRGEPGSGSLPLGQVIEALTASGYEGKFALEYKPTDSTRESLHRMHFA